MSPTVLRVLLSWQWDPLVSLGILLAGGLYALGCVRLVRRPHGHLPVPVWRVCAYAGGLLTLVVALLSPLHTFDNLLFSLHMVEHLLLMLFAAPLLLLGAPLVPLLWGLPQAERRTVARLLLSRKGWIHRVFHLLTEPLVAVALFCITMGLWHVPRFYDAAQGPTLMHSLEHALFLGTSLLFWWGIVHPTGGKRRVPYALGLVCLLAPMLEGMLIGALLTFATQPLYATYRDAPRIVGLSALDDQQLAGLIMWVPAGMVLMGGSFILLALFFQEETRQADRQLAALRHR